MQKKIFTLFNMLAFTHLVNAASSNCQNPKDVEIGNDVVMRFCQIPAAVGVPIGSGRGDEAPIKARFFRSFQIAQFEVTQLQYRTLMSENPSEAKKGWNRQLVNIGDNYPVVFVRPDDAELFVKFLNVIDRTATYRLPTEAEYEYATNAGAKTEYFWGDVLLADKLFYIGNSDPTPGSGQFARSVYDCPHINGISEEDCSNSFGLYHMLGNVWEWTADSYSDNYLDAPDNGQIPYRAEKGSRYQYYRVARGGAWDSDALQTRTSKRGKARTLSYFNVGFRVVREQKQAKIHSRN